MEKHIYSEDAKKLVEENLKRGMNITDSIKDVCIDLGIEYKENYRKRYSKVLNKKGVVDNVTKLEQSAQFKAARKHKISKSSKYYIISSAQNNTPVHKEFMANIEAYAKHLKAEIGIIALRYKNPTSVFKDADKDNYWDKSVEPYLTANRHNIHKHLMVLADVKTQPTAVNPLSGITGLSGLESCIIGHPKVALQSAPVLNGYPSKLLLSTGSVTVPNYTDSAAGKKGEFHHSYGFVLVEIKDKDTFFVRHVTATKDGSFYDLNNYVSNGEVVKNTQGIPAMVLGDLHVGEEDKDAVEATFDMMEKLNPSCIVLHDTFSGYSVNHHDEKNPFILLEKELNDELDLQDEIQRMLNTLERFVKYNPIVTSANHNTFLDRWLCSTDWRKSRNKATYLKYASLVASGKCPLGVVAYEIQQRFGDKIKCLGYDDSFRILGWEVAQHGDLGVNGSRGSANQYKNVNTKMITAHSHTPSRQLGHVCVGTLTKLRLNYNKGLSSWMHSNAVIQPDGKCQQIHIINGNYTTLN